MSSRHGGCRQLGFPLGHINLALLRKLQGREDEGDQVTKAHWAPDGFIGGLGHTKGLGVWGGLGGGGAEAQLVTSYRPSEGPPTQGTPFILSRSEGQGPR